jgi:hypothetical protein
MYISVRGCVLYIGTGTYRYMFMYMYMYSSNYEIFTIAAASELKKKKYIYKCVLSTSFSTPVPRLPV